MPSTSSSEPRLPWWQTAVVYQVWPRSFADGDGDGIGDLPGLRSRLDHLSDLGVDALWLSPVYPSPQVDNGYDVSDYQGVDPLFGTLADLDGLIADLHARGMKLVMDVVVNHTSDQHPWFQESRSSRDNPKRDWYFWRAEPTPLVSVFSGSAWEADSATGEYYLHTFARQQPDLNWDNPEVRAAVAEMLRWWVDRGVDGFRFDVISMISKNDRHVWGFGPHLHDYLQELHREVLAGHDLMSVGETPGITIEQARLMTAARRQELDMVFQFEHVGLDHELRKWDPKPMPLSALKQCLARWQDGLAEEGWNSLYWDNHDQPRVVSRWGDDGVHRAASAKTLATVLHLHRGTPYVYQGEELGMRNAGFTSIAQYQDLESLNHYAEAVAAGESSADVLAGLARMSRDNARTPMQWDDSAYAGFTSGTPWLPVNPDHVEVNVAAQRDDPDSVLAHYRRLIALRHEEPAVALGDFALLLPDHEQLWSFTRRLDGVELLVLANCSGDELPVDVPAGDWQLLLGTHACPADAVLRPWESRVLRRSV